MTRRALRIATIIIIIQSFLFFPAPISRAQDSPHPTQAEVIAAQETADLFMKRLDETGDFSSVIDEMYAEDFIERYIQQEILEGKESDSSASIFFEPGLRIKRDLLKQATAEDWRRLYIAANNFMYHVIITELNKHADDMLNGRELDDKATRHCIPSKVIELFNNHPILKDTFEFDVDDENGESGDGASDEENGGDGPRKKSKPKRIETPEEMQSVSEIFQECSRILGDLSPRLTEPAKSAIEVIRLKLKEKGMMEPSIEVADKKFLGLPPGARVLNVPTPIGLWLEIAEVNGKPKIVRARLWAEC